MSTHLVEFGVEGATVLHVLHEVGSLTLVRSNDANLLRLHSGAKEASNGFLHVRCLGSVTDNALETFTSIIKNFQIQN